MPDQHAILGLAVTPAVQRTQFLSTLMPGEVNRIRRTLVTASGKGVNVALALHQLGGKPRLIGFRGGDSGRFIADEMRRLGIESHWIEVPTPTRHCHTLIEDNIGRVTELVEESAPPAIRVVNPIGSGDCFTAGMLHAFSQGHSLPEAARFGIACGSANAETETPAHFEAKRLRYFQTSWECPR